MTSGALVRWIWRGYLNRLIWVLILGAMFMAVEGAMLGALSYMIRPMFDEVFVTGNRSAVYWVGGAVFGIFLARAIAGAVQRVLMQYVAQNMTAAIQTDMLRHILSLDSGWFQTNSPGVLIERVRGDTTVAGSIWGVLLSAVGRDMVALLSLFAVALSIDWLWTLIAVAAGPILVAPLMFLFAAVRRTSKLAREIAAGLTARLDETFHGIDTVKLNGVEAREVDRYATKMRGYVWAQLKAEAGHAGIPAVMDIIAGIGFFGVLIYGGFQIIEGDKTVGEFMSFFTAMALVFEPLRRLGNVSGSWAVAAASLERIYRVLEVKPTILSPATPERLSMSPDQADVAFADVAFSYGDTPVLRGVSFTAKAGQTTALVGASGAGKSTVFRLLTRLADPNAGAVQIGGVDVAALDLAALRGMVAVVTQDAQLFDETVTENIVMDQPNRDLAPVLHAAHVQEFLAKLDDGPDTRVGPRGSGLSGGQKQRVAIARALYRDAPILLLDEATSALDTRSEQVVQAALDRLAAGRTTLVIAHRLSTVRAADKIVVFDAGKVVEQGAHTDLLAQGGVYARLYRLQFPD